MYDDRISKTLITLAVENALLKMGLPELELVTIRLKQDHQCEISDCMKYPEYLRETLLDLFGNSYSDILQSIQETLQKTTMEQPLIDFLIVLDDHS
ncbi:MAG: hypothetical protein EPO37_00260 [Nitrosarchaeum sp.]|nr:MAG: hypothetical protein EPO37_00260 [Nitrosarchaeum sp.]